MPLVHLVILIALVEYFIFGWLVGRARVRYNVPAPATTGDENFLRYYRAQANTLELLIIFIPSMLFFGQYFGKYAAAALGVLFIIGRALYFYGYVQAASKRHFGFLVSGIAVVALLIGAILGALRALPYG
jgi:glutathione S-transferase